MMMMKKKMRKIQMKYLFKVAQELLQSNLQDSEVRLKTRR